MIKTIDKKIENQFFDKLSKDSRIKNAFLLVNNEGLNIDINLCLGLNSYPNQQYYIASIGKVFTSVIIGQMYEKKLLDYDDRVATILGHEIIDGIHTYKNINYASCITLRQLLNHTSGIGDYFEDKPKYDKPMLEKIKEYPYLDCAPIDIVNWSKKNIDSLFKPGCGFHYSDTGYHLLGLVIEKIIGIPLDQVMENYIFKPLNMKRTYLTSNHNHVKLDDNDICDVYWNEKNVKDYSIFRNDFAGGGIVTTSSDLLIFFKSIVNHELITKSTLDRMKTWSKFTSLKLIGIEYGLGLMNLKTIPFLFPKKFSSYGHIGSIGSFMFYNPYSETFILGSVNRFLYQRKSMKLMFSTLKMVISEYEKNGRKNGFKEIK